MNPLRKRTSVSVHMENSMSKKKSEDDASTEVPRQLSQSWQGKDLIRQQNSGPKSTKCALQRFRDIETNSGIVWIVSNLRSTDNASPTLTLIIFTLYFHFWYFTPVF